MVDRLEKPLNQLKEGLGPFLPFIQRNTELLKPVFIGGKLLLSAERLFCFTEKNWSFDLTGRVLLIGFLFGSKKLPVDSTGCPVE